MYFTQTIITSLSLIAAASATTLYANKGCVIADNQKLCHNAGSVFVSGKTNILACIADCASGQGQCANCQFNREIPANWKEAWYGEDNCVYSKGPNPIQVGCSKPITEKPVPCVYRC